MIKFNLIYYYYFFFFDCILISLHIALIRDSRVLNLSAPQVYVTNRIGEEDVVSTTNKKFPGSNTVINHKQIQNGGFIPNQGIGHQFASNGGYQFGNGGSYRPNDNYVIPPREISETDLYLLGAMEKLVYRLDFMEKRMRHMEQMLYYVINSGNKDTGSNYIFIKNEIQVYRFKNKN